MTASSIDTQQATYRTDYHAKAEEVAQRVAQQWQDTGSEDTRALADAVYQALVEEANLELRQVLATVQGQLQLAEARAARGQPTLTTGRIGELLQSLDRATVLMDTFLDRASAAKLIIQLDREPLDLAECITDYVRMNGIERRVRTAFGPAYVDADRSKLVQALGHLVTRFYFAARPHENVVVSACSIDGRVEGFIGLSPSHLQPEQLMDEIRLPLRIEDVGIDVAYVRAILERHGGTLFVATADDASVGFGFYLPALEAYGDDLPDAPLEVG